MFMRQTIAWTLFLQLDLFVKTTLRRVYKIPDAQEISTRLLIPASVAVALMSTFIVMPFDCVKTQMEKKETTKTYTNTFKSVYNQAGLLGFYTGFRLRFLLYLTNSMFTVNFLEKLESIKNYMSRE